MNLKGKKVVTMIFDFPDCGGCRTCELACSFHFTKEFNDKNSAIKIVEKEKGGFLVNFLDKCDSCLNKEEPLCIQYCKESEKLKELLDKYVSYKK
jgi:carbon-monoxide dehydrogenase iron sulfur subunit